VFGVLGHDEMAKDTLLAASPCATDLSTRSVRFSLSNNAVQGLDDVNGTELV